MPAPWNSCPVCLIARNDRTGEDSLNLPNRGDAIPLGFTPWNLGFVCLGGRNARINVECPIKHLPFRSIAIPLGQNLYHRGKALPSGFGHALSRYPIKLH